MRCLSKISIALACTVIVACATVAWRFHAQTSPRVWAAREVPVAFWTWRAQAPSDEAVERAVRATRAQELFVRAGQIDYEKGKLRRIRPVEGRFPRALSVHLVYNTTRTLLTEFERVGESALAAIVLENFLKDSARASTDGARVAGLQLDFDVPTRLLARYGRVLRLLRVQLPTGTRLSVTGLPTWMESNELRAMLDAVDFWIPQFYGAEIPQRLEQSLPITSPSFVARDARGARAIRKPFYAGLPAYSHAMLYGADGALIALRGDLDPTRVARDPNFELIERRPFDAHASATIDSRDNRATRQPNNNDDGKSSDDKSDNENDDEGGSMEGVALASEWRYVYRARGEGVVDGLSVRAGDSLVFVLPSSASLRASVRGVREHAGESLLGICIFRLPERDDPATLAMQQIAAALAADTDDVPANHLQLRQADAFSNAASAHSTIVSASPTLTSMPPTLENQTPSNHLSLSVENRGTTSALMGDDAMQLTLGVAAGSVRGIVRLDGFTSVETLCGDTNTRDTDERATLRPCGLRRANALRFKSPTWSAGARAGATISLERDAPSAFPVALRIKTDDGRTFAHAKRVRVETIKQRATVAAFKDMQTRATRQTSPKTMRTINK
jgi:hypothetical protein